MILAPFPADSGSTAIPSSWLPTLALGIQEHELRSQPRDVATPEIVRVRREAARQAGELILMVDDEVLNAEMTGAFLLQAGYTRFRSTDRPEQAMALMRRDKPAIVLLDMSMPKVSGLELLAQVRQDAELRDVAVIVLTSSTEQSVKLQALAAGAADFLLKPVDSSELTLRIRNTLAARAYRDHLAQHDPLTAVPNKLRYRQALIEVIAAARARGTAGAVLHVGVDGLGRVNDALGRSVGDQLLQRLAKRLESCMQTEADGELSDGQHHPSLYRYDGDEFAILVPHIDGVPTAAAFISRVLEEATVHYRRTGVPEVFVTCSVGVSMFPADSSDPDILVRNAGLALRHAKQSRMDRYEFFSPAFNEQALKSLDLGAELRLALERNQIELLFEPRINLGSRRLAAAQAILRWKHGPGRVIEGDELMELAGTSDMDVMLTEWLFEQIRLQIRKWKAAGLVPVPIAMKAPLAHIQPRDLGHLVNAALLAGLDPRLLCIELQQVAGLTDRDAATLTSLRLKGVRFALDRFGTSASVSHLRRLMVDELKMDASFTQELGQDEQVQGLLLGMGDLARRLRLTAVACGITDSRQLSFLRKNDWQQGQGPGIGRPAAGDKFAADWLERAPKR